MIDQKKRGCSVTAAWRAFWNLAEPGSVTEVGRVTWMSEFYLNHIPTGWLGTSTKTTATVPNSSTQQPE